MKKIHPKLKKVIEQKGFSMNDCPYTPIKKEWEQFPIIKAIRQAEKETRLTYTL